jgi:hypothetical protein
MMWATGGWQATRIAGDYSLHFKNGKYNPNLPPEFNTFARIFLPFAHDN